MIDARHHQPDDRIDRGTTSESARLRARDWPTPPLQHPQVAVLTDANFQTDVLESALPVIVDFWSETCVPCRRQEPTIARLAEELTGRAKVGRLSVFENPQVIRDFRVRGVPHMIVVKQGEVVLELVGDHSIEQLRTHLSGLGL